MKSPECSIETLDDVEVSRLLDAHQILLIDVREPTEYATARIPGAFLYPLSNFDPGAIPEDGLRRVVLHCGSGKRSLEAAGRLIAAGRHAVHMGGGIAAWSKAGLPVIAAAAP